MPHSSSILFFSSTSSSTVMLPSCSKTVVDSVAIDVLAPPRYSVFVVGCPPRALRCLVRLLLGRRLVSSSPRLPARRPPLRPRSAAGFRRRRVGHSAELVDACVDQPDQVLQRGVEQPGQLRERRDDRRRATWALSTSSGGSLASSSTSAPSIDSTLEHPPRSVRIFVSLRGVGQRLCHGDGVAVGLDEGDRGRPSSNASSASAPAASRGPPGQGVLDDRERRAVVAAACRARRRAVCS